MAGQMGAKNLLPVHWGTFTLSSEPADEPIRRLRKALEHHSPLLAVDAIGKTWKL
jgi:L-ascorbate metabolism protein UlaG (beta-lactamase superfamily)